MCILCNISLHQPVQVLMKQHNKKQKLEFWGTLQGDSDRMRDWRLEFLRIWQSGLFLTQKGMDVSWHYKPPVWLPPPPPTAVRGSPPFPRAASHGEGTPAPLFPYFGSLHIFERGPSM